MGHNVFSYFFNRSQFKKLIYFFPIQLIFVHIKNNPILVLSWLLIIGIINQLVLSKYGVPFLFLTPEYLGNIGFLSYLIVGFSFGGFIMAFNISSYIINGHRFPFIATLSRPFFKYYLNNFFFGAVLVLMYYFTAFRFLLKEGASVPDILIYLLGFTLGFLVITVLSLTYFINTNKDFVKLFGFSPEEKRARKSVRTVLHKKVKWHSFFNPDREWKIETYLSSFSKVSIARSTDHYDSEMLRKVFSQNHVNAMIFEVVVLISIVALSFGSDIRFFILPAGASLTLMFTIFIMITSAIHTWFRRWSSLVLLILLLSINYFSKFSWFNPDNKAYGLNYDNPHAIYSPEEIKKSNRGENFAKDYFHTIKILENWRKKNTDTNGGQQQKPKIVFINTTGGGMRSALWSFYSIQFVDSVLKGELLKHTQLVAGSSGGMIGMSYLRELYLQQQQGKINNIYSNEYSENICKDILNRVGFTWTVNDILFKLRSFNDGDNVYKIDRGYAFEQQLNENTGNVMKKRLYEYFLPEYESKIPMVILSPTIVNDGRRLLISPQPISYLSYCKPQENISNDVLIEAIEFNRFFKNNDASNLQFSSALRMSSTFPFIMPLVKLPSNPQLEVMDAGVRDNFGIKTTMKFLYTFKNWIASNTSGVIIIQIRDLEKKTPTIENEKSTLLKSISSPVGNIYKNLFVNQDYDHDQLIQYASEWFDGNIDVINLSLDNDEKNLLSLSWHLTQKEKNRVYNSIKSAQNQKSIKKLSQLIEQ